MHDLTRTADTPQGKIFWAVIATLVLAQLVAFWMLCSQQVSKAAVRDAGLQVERSAIADCLRHVPDATRNSCARQVAASARPANPVMVVGDTPRDVNAAARATMSSAIPVNFTLR